MPKTICPPIEHDTPKTLLPEPLTPDDIAEMLTEAAEVDAFFQTGIPRRSRAYLQGSIAGKPCR
jgi:hypothetical protein